MTSVMEATQMETTSLAPTIIATLDDLSKEALIKLCTSIYDQLNFSTFENFLFGEKILFLENQISYLNDQIELRDLSLPFEKSESYEEGFIDGQHCALESSDKNINESVNDPPEILVIKTEKDNQKCETPISKGKWELSLLKQIEPDDNLTVISEISIIQDNNSSIDDSEVKSSIEDNFHLVKGKHSKSPPCKFLNSLSNERAKTAFITTEKFVLEKLKNTNIDSGLLKWICENQSVPKEHYATLSSYDIKHNPTFDEKFWSTTDGKISNFANIFNKRNPQFYLELKGRGHAKKKEKIY